MRPVLEMHVTPQRCAAFGILSKNHGRQTPCALARIGRTGHGGHTIDKTIIDLMLTHPYLLALFGQTQCAGLQN